MTSTGPNVRRARSSEQAKATQTLALAFGNDPVMSWLTGAGHETSQRVTHLFGHMLRTELTRRDHLVDITDDGHAVALWHDVDEWKSSAKQIARVVPSALKTFGRHLPRALKTLSMIEKVHPDEPHRHLAFIGVHPSHQGHGRGGALLAEMTRDCDAHGVGAYLESSNPRNDALYARFGFESRGPVPLPKGAPVMTAMWRNPH